MTSEERKGIRNFIDRLEAFLLTHDDDHLVLVGHFGEPGHSGKLGIGCPVAQITGKYGLQESAAMIAKGAAPSELIGAIGVFYKCFDQALVELRGGHRIETIPLSKARSAIRRGIEKVRITYDLDETAPIGEPAILKTEIPVAI